MDYPVKKMFHVNTDLWWMDSGRYFVSPNNGPLVESVSLWEAVRLVGKGTIRTVSMSTEFLRVSRETSESRDAQRLPDLELPLDLLLINQQLRDGPHERIQPVRGFLIRLRSPRALLVLQLRKEAHVMHSSLFI